MSPEPTVWVEVPASWVAPQGEFTFLRDDTRSLVFGPVLAIENGLCGCADADRTYAEMEAHYLADIERLREKSAKLAQTIAAFPDAHIAANIAHARAERDQLRAANATARELATQAGRTLCGAGWNLDPAAIIAALDQPAVEAR